MEEKEILIKIQSVVMLMTKGIHAMTNHRTEGCASNIARIRVVPDRGTPPEICIN